MFRGCSVAAAVHYGISLSAQTHMYPVPKGGERGDTCAAAAAATLHMANMRQRVKCFRVGVKTRKSWGSKEASFLVWQLFLKF